MQMHRHRIVYAGADRRLAQMLAQAIAFLAADHVLVKDMAGIGPAPWQRNGQSGATIVLAGAPRLGPRAFAFQPRPLDREDYCLERVGTLSDVRAVPDVM